MRWRALFLTMTMFALLLTAGVPYAGTESVVECKACSAGPFLTHHFDSGGGECDPEFEECVECGGTSPAGHANCHMFEYDGQCYNEHEGCPGPVEDAEQLAVLFEALRSHDDKEAGKAFDQLHASGRVLLNQSRRAIQILDCKQSAVLASFPTSSALYAAAKSTLAAAAQE
jgi:hypothetical protein